MSFVCKLCGVLKPSGDFYWRKNQPTWRSGYCKECDCTKRRQYNWKIRNNINVVEAERLRKEVKNCEICGVEKSLQVDHDHSTGKIRGMLCFNCNAGLGLFKDNKEFCLKAVKYLEK